MCVLDILISALLISILGTPLSSKVNSASSIDLSDDLLVEHGISLHLSSLQSIPCECPDVLLLKLSLLSIDILYVAVGLWSHKSSTLLIFQLPRPGTVRRILVP